jgi:hypothetical protein
MAGILNRILPPAFCAFYFLALAYPTHLRVVGTYFTETDLYGRYAPDADLIAAGRVPQSSFNPPGYPLLLALVHPLTGDHLTSGKWLSLIAAALGGLMAFHLFRPLFGYRSAILALAIIFLSGEFTKFSVQATTDVLFASLCIATMLVLMGGRPGSYGRAALVGILSGLAYLVRYNGVAMLVPGIVGVAAWCGAERRLGHRLKMGAAYLASFLGVISPWLWLNYATYGSPFYSTNYRDVAVKFLVPAAGSTSLGDVVLHDPLRFASLYAWFLLNTLWQSVGASFAVLPVGPLALAGVVLSLIRRRPRGVDLLLVSALAHILALNLTHWETRYYFYVMFCYAGLAAYATFEIADWVALTPARARLVWVAIVVLILVPSGMRAYKRVLGAVEGQPYELLDASAFLRQLGGEAVTMAFKPHLAYLSNHRWIRLSEVGSVEALRSVVQANGADYLVADRFTRRSRGALSALLDRQDGLPWLEPLYCDTARSLVIYAVRREGRDARAPVPVPERGRCKASHPSGEARSVDGPGLRPPKPRSAGPAE